MKVNDKQLYKRYVDGFLPVISRFEGRVLATLDKSEILEGERNVDHFVVLEFIDRESAERFWYSPEYRELVKYRHGGAESQVLMFERIDKACT